LCGCPLCLIRIRWERQLYRVQPTQHVAIIQLVFQLLLTLLLLLLGQRKVAIVVGLGTQDSSGSSSRLRGMSRLIFRYDCEIIQRMGRVETQQA
jgi:hypothetical protein